MKFIITTLIFLILCANTALAVVYNATIPKNLDVTTPPEGFPPRDVNDSIREIKTVLKNQYAILSVGTDTTLTGTSTFIIGSSTTALTLNFPAASSIAQGTCTKEYVILNRNTGTITLNIAVEGITGSPTVSRNNDFLLYTDGTTWYEKRVQNAFNATNFAGFGTSSFARSGANSDITAITGLTTYLAIGQGGSGTNTAAGAASAFGVGTEDSPTFTGVTATTGSTTTHTSTTITATTGNITNISATAGTFTGNVQVDSMSGLEDADIPPDITLTNITQITNRSHNDITGTGTNSHAVIDSHIADASDPHGATLTQTNINSTAATATTFYSTTANITTGNITNINTTTATATTLYNSNFSGGNATLTGNIQASSASGFNFVSKWTTGSHTAGGTGTVRFEGTGDIIPSSTYDNNGNGTITYALSAGVSAKPDAQVDGVTQVSGPTAYDFPGAFFSITGSSTRAVITHKPVSLATQTTHFLSLATQTTNLLSLATQTTQFLSVGTQTNGELGFNRISGTPTDNSFFVNNIPTVGKILVGISDTIVIPGTTTPLSATSTSQSLYNLIRTKQGSNIDANTVLAIQCNNVGTTTFIDSSNNAYAITANGNAIGSSTTIRSGGLGSGWLDGDGDFLTVADNSGMPNGTNTFSLETSFRLGTVTGGIYFASQFSDGSNNWRWYWESSNNFIYFESTTSGITDFSIRTTNTFTFTPGITYTFCVDRNGTTANDWKMFVDGVSQALSLAEGSYGSSIYAASVALAIGGRTDSTNEINGLIDDFSLSNKSRHQADYVPTTIDTNYNYNTLQVIPPGTTTAFLNIVDNGTFSSNVEIVLGSTTPFASSTVHVLQGILASRTLFSFYDSYCFAESKDIIGSGIDVINEAYKIAKKVNIVKSHPIRPELKVRMEEAKTALQEEYLSLFRNSDIETYKTDHITEYTMSVDGSVSVNLTKLNSDAVTYHENQRKVEFEILPNLKERIKEKKKKMESDKNITQISIIADDPSTDKLLKGADSRTASLNNQIGVLFGAFQKQNEEIGSLTAALENQKVFYNEEIDNLYNLINALILGLVGVGGVAGFTTLRRKRKGT